MDASCDGSRQTEESAFRAWLSQGSQQLAKRAAELVVGEAQTWAWEEFNEAMEKDFQLDIKNYLKNKKSNFQKLLNNYLAINTW